MIDDNAIFGIFLSVSENAKNSVKESEFSLGNSLPGSRDVD